MAKLLVLAIAFAALVTFTAAHTTIVTTTIEDENGIPLPPYIADLDLRQKAQQLPNQCNLQVRRQCDLGNIRTVITTLVEEENYSRRSSRGSQQCSEVQGRQFNQYQRYIQQQQQQGGSLLMSINRQGQLVGKPFVVNW
ncbi:2S seed storage protein-like [Rutidosis leptorrhynchoides]|uniref:2S seed storage protein-like n=1 Tax=Rutidosis leptorrhynchoides TaxID=125765 RepID=UPI003A98D1EE